MLNLGSSKDESGFPNSIAYIHTQNENFDCLLYVLYEIGLDFRHFLQFVPLGE